MFNPPRLPEAFNLLRDSLTRLLEIAYWSGVRDGALATALALVLLYLFFGPPRRSAS